MKYTVVWEGTPKTRKQMEQRVVSLPPRDPSIKKTIEDWGYSKPMSEMTNEEYLEYMRIRNKEYYRRNLEKAREKQKGYYIKKKERAAINKGINEILNINL